MTPSAGSGPEPSFASTETTLSLGDKRHGIRCVGCEGGLGQPVVWAGLGCWRGWAGLGGAGRGWAGLGCAALCVACWHGGMGFDFQWKNFSASTYEKLLLKLPSG